MDIEKYYQTAPVTSQSQLNSLRALLVSLLPAPTERLSYGIPHLFVNNKRIIGFGGFAHHVSIFPGGGSLIEKYAHELESYKTSRGTIQFPLDKPLPVKVIKAIVEDCLTAVDH